MGKKREKKTTTNSITEHLNRRGEVASDKNYVANRGWYVWIVYLTQPRENFLLEHHSWRPRRAAAPHQTAVVAMSFILLRGGSAEWAKPE